MNAPWQQAGQRIFISYRRGDTQWVAGRLADTLAAYFGDKRVFRDIEGIAGGADFGAVIQHSLSSADAVIVLIGRDWLTVSDEQDRRRLDDPDDWVSQEVSAALAAGIPVYPVLVEGTPMPRAEELPEPLRPLTRYNAISISDQRWQADVARLAKIIALDIPSATERQLHLVNLAISTVLFLVMALTATIVVSNLLQVSSPINGPDGLPEWSLGQLFQGAEIAGDRTDIGKCLHPPLPWFTPLSTAQSGLIFLVIVPASALLFVFARNIDPARRRYFLAAAWTGASGALLAFILFYPVCEEYEPVVVFYLGLLVAPLMLVLMGLSGFRAR